MTTPYARSRRRRALLCAGALLCAASTPARAQTLAPAQGCDILSAAAPHGTFVLYDPAADAWTACDRERAETRFLPASTFKLPHALIAIETGIVTNETAPFSWDKRERRIAAWNRDTSLADGVRNSTVWVYQRTAKAIGWDRMNAWVRRFGYGNAEIGDAGGLAHFWLDGDLRISTTEQVLFLDALRRGALPANPANQARVRAMAVVERADGGDWRLHAKSGAVLPIDPKTGDIAPGPDADARLAGKERVGWYVGWVERPKDKGGDRVFALNLRLTTDADLAKRKPLARALLEANGALPPSRR